MDYERLTQCTSDIYIKRLIIIHDKAWLLYAKSIFCDTIILATIIE